MRRIATVLMGSAWLACFGGCELTEVTTPEGRDILVVEAVISAGEQWQNVLLHRTLTGPELRGEPGALVLVRNSDGAEVVLQENATETCARDVTGLTGDSLQVRATCYSAFFAVEPGQTYELHVSTEDGLALRGRTTVPGEFHLLTPAVPYGQTCLLPPLTNLPLVWSQSAGAWAYFARMSVSGLRGAFAESGIEAPEHLQLTGLAISQDDTTMALPRDFGLFERFNGDQQLLVALQGGFPPGPRVELALSAADKNYVNGVRGGAFNPSGNVRVSSVVGDGVGVFGSLLTRRVAVQVGESYFLPDCLENLSMPQ